MTTYVEDDNGGTITEACLYHCAPGAPAWCFGAHCQCQCHVEQRDAATLIGEGDVVDPDRARELDDRPADKLRVIASEMDREQYGDPRDLTAERFGPVDSEKPQGTFPQQPVDALTSDVARIIAKNHSPYTGRPTTTDDVIRRYGHRLSTGPLAWPDLPGNAGVSRNGEVP